METLGYVFAGIAGIVVLAAAMAGLRLGWEAFCAYRRQNTTTSTAASAAARVVAPRDDADRAIDFRVALEDPVPPENEGPAEGSRLWVYRDTHGRILGVERRRWPARGVTPRPAVTVTAVGGSGSGGDGAAVAATETTAITPAAPVVASAEEAAPAAAPTTPKPAAKGGKEEVKLKQLYLPPKQGSTLDALWRVWFLGALPEQVKERVSQDPALYKQIQEEAAKYAADLEETPTEEPQARQGWSKFLREKLGHLL